MEYVHLKGPGNLVKMFSTIKQATSLHNMQDQGTT